MLEVKINKEEQIADIHAKGYIPEMLNDIAILLNGIYRQLQAANPNQAQAFRYGIMGLIADPNSPVWGDMGDYIGFAIKKN